MSRKQAIESIRAAGANNDQQAMLRIFTENKVSFAAASKAWAEGARLRICAEA